jgi:hypothetical protein
MNINKYQDPHDYQNIIDKLVKLPTVGDIKMYLDDIYPNWIIKTIPTYSDDYINLYKNWKLICEQNNIKPSVIVIVDEINYDNNHNLINFFAETMTRVGMLVRTKEEITECSKCGLAIPTLPFYNKLKIKEPKNWSNKCINC